MEEIEKKSEAPKSTESDALEVAKEVKQELEAYRKPFEKQWREYDDAYYGKQHKTGETNKTTKNHIFRIIEGEVPILTDSSPGTQITASIQEKQEDADILNKAVTHVYKDQNLPLILPSLVRSSCISAPGYLYAWWNPDADGGEGKIEYKQLSWEMVWLDGSAQTIEQADCAKIKIPMRKGAAARLWPDKKDEILQQKAPDKDLSSGTDDNFEQRDVSGGNAPDMGKPKQNKSKDIVDYVETWKKSYELEDIPSEETAEQLHEEYEQIAQGQPPSIGKWEDHKAHTQSHTQQRAEVLSAVGLPADAPIEQLQQMVAQLVQQNPQAQEQLGKAVLIAQMIDNHNEEHAEFMKLNETGQRPKYGDGWRVIRTVGNVVVYDGGNPEYTPGREGMIPLVPFYCYKDDTIYGFGEVKNIIDAQRTLNDVDWREYQGLKVVSNPGWVKDHEAELEDNKLTNEPGIVVTKKKGTEVRRLEPGQVSPQLEARKQLDAEFMREASGVNEASQGDISGAQSGIAIQKQQNQAIGRIRLKDRYLQGYSVRRLAIITASLIINHWTEERRFRLRSDNTHIEEVIYNPLKMADLEYTVDISPGSMAGIDKDSLNAFYLNLLTGQHIPFEDFLMVADFPKKEILLAKLKERNEQGQMIDQGKQTIEQLGQQNAALKGVISPALVGPDQKPLFEQFMREAAIKQLTEQQAQGNPQDPAMAAQQQIGNAGAPQGQPTSQG